ncbi:MAG TPA: FKBP-type peptidyl-prolyl cis-trans isomerase [Nocardioides sp.]|nr:FKBP-type peptidyl-prolyl cis-trans isomerase [Nocardioides sp.]
MHTRTSVRLLTAAFVAAAVVLAGCGSDSSSNDSSSSSGNGKGWDSTEVSGAVGSGVTVKFNGEVTDSTQSTKVLEEGDGETVEQGDSLILQTVIADGTTQKTVASSYNDHQPQVVTLSSQVTKIFLDALSGKTIGSRVAVYAPAETVFGPSGNPQLGVSQKDPVMLVFDLLGKPLNGPDGKRHAAPSWFPKIGRTKGTISGLDFKGTPEPNGKLRSAALYDGTGPVVKKGQTIFVRYLGQVYGGKKPFDENFSGADPVSFQIGAGKVIKGWDKTLVGQHVGSEVVVAIPPADGYGKQGNSQAGIKGTDTLYFVVDILGAA